MLLLPTPSFAFRGIEEYEGRRSRGVAGLQENGGVSQDLLGATRNNHELRRRMKGIFLGLRYAYPSLTGLS